MYKMSGNSIATVQLPLKTHASLEYSHEYMNARVLPQSISLTGTTKETMPVSSIYML